MDSFDNVYADFNLAIDQYLEEKKQEKEMNGKIQNGCISSANMQVSEPGVININPHVSELLKCIEPWSNKDIARLYFSSGCCPVVCNDEKRPLIKEWNKHSHPDYASANHIPIQEDYLDAAPWFGSDESKSVGIKTGIASGFLEVIDIEDDSTYREWMETILGSDILDVVEQCPMTRTPNGGAHIFIFQPEGTNIERNQPLALSYDIIEGHKGHVMIETRGEGGQVIVPKSPHSPETHRQHYMKGKRYWVRTIPREPKDRLLVSPEMAEKIKNSCRAITQLPLPEKKHPKTPQLVDDTIEPQFGSSNSSIFTEFNTNKDMQRLALDLLHNEGWTTHSLCGDGYYLTRPGKAYGSSCSASWGRTSNSDLGYPYLWVYSSNAIGWETEITYSPWDVVRKLKYEDNNALMIFELDKKRADASNMLIENDPQFQYNIQKNEAPPALTSDASVSDNVIADSLEQKEPVLSTIIDGKSQEINQNSWDTRTHDSPVNIDKSCVRVSEGKGMKPFPMDVLHPKLQVFINSLCETMGVDPCMAALPLISTSAGCIGTSRMVHVHSAYRQYACLWTLNIMGSGGGKSPVLNTICNPIGLIDTRMQEDNKARRKMYESLLAAWESDGKKLGLPEPEEPKYNRLVIDDATIETAEVILEGNEHGLVCLQHEMNCWFDGLTRNSKADLGSKWCKFYDGSEVRVDRIGRPAVLLKNPLISLSGMVQSNVLAKHLTGDRYEQGVGTRFVIASPPVRKSYFKDVEGELIGLSEWTWLVEQIANLRNIPSLNLELSRRTGQDGDSAYKIHENFYNLIEDRIHASTGIARSIASKCRLWALRYALAYSVIKQVFNGNLSVNDPVDAESMRKGVKFALWALEETIRCSALLIEENQSKGLKEILQWLSAREGPITPRDLQRAFRKEYPKVEMATTALTSLVQDGLVECRPHTPPTGGKTTYHFYLKRPS